MIAVASLVFCHFEGVAVYLAVKQYKYSGEVDCIMLCCAMIFLAASAIFSDIARLFYRKLGLVLFAYTAVLHVPVLYFTVVFDPWLFFALLAGAVGTVIVIFDEIDRIARGSPL